MTVNCYAPVVSKTAAGTYDERHEWDVEKTVSPVSQSAFAGDTVSYEWTVVVTEQTFEENFEVAGDDHGRQPGADGDDRRPGRCAERRHGCDDRRLHQRRPTPTAS